MAIIVPILTTFNDKGIKSAVREFQTATTQIQKFGAVGKIFGEVGQSLTKNVTVPIVALGGALGIMVKGAMEAAAAQQRLGQILMTTGGASAEQVQVLLKQAQALEEVGVVSKENIVTTQAQLSTFDLQASTIAKLTPAILDYVTAEKGAAATAEDFKSMTNGLAQALNGQFGSLTRVGFVLDEDTKKKIANGTESEKAAALVEVLNSTYKDFNQSLADTPQGQMIVLAREFGSLRDEIGSVFLPVVLEVAKVIRERVIPEVQKLVDKFKALSPETIETGLKILGVIAVLGPLLIIFGKVIGAVKTFIEVFKILQLVLLTNPIYLVAAGLALLVVALIRAWQTSDEFRKGLAKLGNMIVSVGEGAVNLFIKYLNEWIKRFNLVIGVLQFFGADIKKIGELGEVSFKRISFASVDAGKKVSGLSDEASDLGSTLSGDLNPFLDDSNAQLENTSTKAGKAKEALKKLKEEAKKAAQTIVDNLEDSLRSAENQLDSAKSAFTSFKNSIKGVVTGILNFGDAAEEGSFIQNITKQAADATVFADKVKKLIVGGLSERAIQQVLDAGFEAGSKIADEIIAGGATMIEQVNTLVASVDSIANVIGEYGADVFYGEGVRQGEALVAGIRASLEAAKNELLALQRSLTTGETSPSVTATPPSSGQLKQDIRKPILTNKQIASISKFTDPATRHYTALATALNNKTIKLAKGGIVTGPTNALIGEAGPEAVIPLSGANSMGMGSNYYITVNAGIGTSGSQVGREIVDAIKKFEKTSGPVFASA